MPQCNYTLEERTLDLLNDVRHHVSAIASSIEEYRCMVCNPEVAFANVTDGARLNFAEDACESLRDWLRSVSPRVARKVDEQQNAEKDTSDDLR